MDCVILCAGEGKRMRPLTASSPKVMLFVANKPMLEYLIESASNTGIKNFVLVVGYCEKSIRDYFGDGSKFGVTIKYTKQRRQSGTADALLAAEGLVSGNFLMLNGDMILNSDDILSFSKESAPCVGTYESSHPEDFGVVVSDTSDGKNRVVKLVEKSKNPPGNIINAGIYLFESGVFEILKGLTLSERGEYELTDALERYIEGKKLTSHLLSSWSDIGEPWNLLDANEAQLKKISAGMNSSENASANADVKIRNSGIIEEGVLVHGTLIVGEGSTVRSGTYIDGICIIGKNCDIGPHAYIRGCSAIGDNCHIGHSVELKNSIIFHDTKVPHFNYIGDSVVGSRCNFGAGTKVANLRHDNKNVRVNGRDTGKRKFGAVIGDDVKFGINCSVNTGSMIESRVKAAPGSYISGRVLEDTVVKR